LKIIHVFSAGVTGSVTNRHVELNNNLVKSWILPLKYKDNYSVNLQGGITIPLKIALENEFSVSFAYKNMYRNKRVLIFGCDKLQIYRDMTRLTVVMNGVEVYKPLLFGSYFGNYPVQYTMVFKDSSIVIYVNGNKRSPDIAYTRTDVAITKLSFGTLEFSADDMNNDFIGDITFYDKALNDDEALRLFEGGKII